MFVFAGFLGCKGYTPYDLEYLIDTSTVKRTITETMGDCVHFQGSMNFWLYDTEGNCLSVAEVPFDLRVDKNLFLYELDHPIYSRGSNK